AFQQPAGGYTVSFYPISSHVAHGRLIHLGRAYGQPYLSIDDFSDGPPLIARFQLRSGSRIDADAVYTGYEGMVVLPLATNRLAVVAEWADELPRAPGADLPELM